MGAVVEVAARRGGRLAPAVATPVRRGALRGQRVALRVPAEAVLDREVELPLAAERAPGEVLMHQIDRLTPFAAGEVYWAWSRLERGRTRLLLRLIVVPRDAVAPGLAALRQMGATVGHLEATLPDGSVQPVPFAPSGAPSAGARGTRVLAVVCLALAIAAAGLPFALQARRLAAVEAELATLRPSVTRVEALRRGLEGAEAGSGLVAAELARTGRPLQALASVTALLPDDSFLAELSLKSGQLVLRGQSANAARLIARLAGDPALRDPAFAAPVTRTDAGTMDLFTIHAALVP